MSASEKVPSFLDPPRHPPPIHKLELLQNRSSQSVPPKSPLKIQQRRKFFTLSMYNSADSDVDSSRNSPVSDAEITWNRSPAQKHYQEALDLRTTTGSCKVDTSAMEGRSNNSLLAGEEQIMEKKKLLAQLTGMNPDAGKTKVFHETSQLAGQSKTVRESLKGFRESSEIPQTNPCRVCRFCGREFPSGRALGGHMRVHGALLDAQLGNTKQGKQIQREAKEKHVGELFGSRAHNALANTPWKLDCEDHEASVEEESTEDRAEAGSMLVKNIHEKLDAPKREEERGDHHVSDLSYSLKYPTISYGLPTSKINNTQIIPGIENVSKANSALYELRRNPKPNQRFRTNEKHHIVAQIMHPFNDNSPHSNPNDPELPWMLTVSDDMQQRSENAVIHPCSECSKVFPSSKALFGHMRCHPEREWRGIQRPRSGGERDRMTKRTVCGDGSTELEFDQSHQNKSNFMEVKKEIAHSDVIDSIKEEGANHNKNKYMKLKLEMMDSVAAEKLASLANGSEAQMLKISAQEMHTTESDCASSRREGGVMACKTHSSNDKLQESMTQSRLQGAVTDDWTPIWPSAGRPRSKRRRISHMHKEPALTSDQTTSGEIKMDQKVYDAGEDMEDLVDPANLLVLLSQSIPEVNKSSTNQESALSHPTKLSRALAKDDRRERAWRNAVENFRDERYDHYEAEDRNSDDDDDTDGDDQADNSHVPANVSVKYQCSTCKKCFNSHQALGGHRASHRKMKGCFARTKSLAAYDTQESSEENNGEEPEYNLSLFRTKGKSINKQSWKEEKERVCRPDLLDKVGKKKFKGHECSICHRVFVTGQALGGHKRCHWTGEKAVGVSDAASVASSSTENRHHVANNNIQDMEEWVCRSKTSKAKEDTFDLNLPAPVDEDDDAGLADACGASMDAKLRPSSMWKHQEWYPTTIAHIPQVCSVKTL